MALVAVLLAAPGARAGDWVQVSCVNPDGSAASNAGWTSFAQGPVTVGDGNSTQCAPGVPLTAVLGNTVAAANGQSQVLEYQPPAGSTLVGGTLNGTFTAYGGSSGARAEADVLEPLDAVDQGDSAFLCINGSGCGSGDAANDAYTGVVAVPANRGGNLYVTATCTALSGYTCDANQGGDNGTWASAAITSGDLLLRSSAAPGGTGFSGSALQPNARGTAHLVFTATDVNGPGVYVVTVEVDGRPVWSGTPSANGGTCAPVGTDSAAGALMFDSSQPCPPSESVDLPVPTAGLTDGRHELTASVTDAAQSTATVLDQTITTSNPQVTPPGRGAGAIHAEFLISWHWQGRTTELRSITVRHLPRIATITVRCTGRGCPRLTDTRAGARRSGRLLRALGGRRLRAGDRLLITVTAARHRAERIRLTIRNNRVPLAALLRP